MFLLPRDKIQVIPRKEKFMKKMIGVLVVSCMCILLGLSVKWGRERRLTLVSLAKNIGIGDVMQ